MQAYIKLIVTITLVTLYSCNTVSDKKNAHADTTTKTVSVNKKSDPKKLGERLKISGDFDGDGKMDTIFESYISELTGKETFKTLTSTDWEENVGLVIRNKPVCRLYTNINEVDTFILTKEAQQIGIALFENLGNLNNIKGDELGYIIDWADNSNLNTYHILILTEQKKWKELFKFPINEAVNYESENLFKNKFLIIKDGLNKIKYKFYSDSATVEEGDTTLK